MVTGSRPVNGPNGPNGPNGRRELSPRVRRRRALWGAAAIVVALVIALAVTRPSDHAGPGSGDPLSGPAASQVAGSPPLEESIAKILADAGDYRVGVALADVQDGTTRTFGDEDPFFAASTAKIITAAAFYHLVEHEEASLDQDLGDYDAAFQLEAMVNNSSNDSWVLLMDAVGYEELCAYAASLGIEYDPEENLLTAADMALVLRKLSAGELLNEEDTAELLGYMQDTNNEDLIPAGSRPGITVHHKYGQLEGELHDAALLTDEDTTVALVIYTEDTLDGGGTEQVELIHELTRTVEDALFPVGG